MYTYKKMADTKKINHKKQKYKILKQYHFSFPIRALIYLNIININKCGIKTI
jgi:hypothetical protein